jgi:branched-chain amino acid transport system permease protein
MTFLQFVLNGLVTGMIYASVAIGFTLIYKIAKFFPFSHGAICSISAYLSYTLIFIFGLPPILSYVISSLAAGIMGLLVDKYIYAKLRVKHADSLAFLLASFGIYIVIQNTIQLIYGAQVISLTNGQFQIIKITSNLTLTSLQLYICCIIAFIFLITILFLNLHKTGKAIRAVADNRLAASLIGINPEAITSFTFFIGSVLSGIGGIIMGMETNLEPSMSTNIFLKSTIASIVGGIGSVYGAILGGLFLGIAESIGIYQFSSAWKDTVSFIILIAFLCFKPYGFLGEKHVLSAFRNRK